MDAVAVDRRQIGDAALRVAERVADMIRPLCDTSIRIPRSKWTVGEAAAHLAIANGMGVKIASGETVAYGDGTPGGLAPANARFLSEFPDRDGARLADLIVDRARSFVQTAARQPDTFVAHTPMGAMDARTGTSYMLCHLLMHGCAIAQALLRKRYPVEPADVELALPFLLHAMPMIVDEKAAQGLNASYDLRFRGGSRVAIMVDKGEVTTGSVPSRRVDCHISADPVAFFLLGSGLASQWPLIARGKLMTWGRKPWLALKLASLFVSP